MMKGGLQMMDAYKCITYSTFFLPGLRSYNPIRLELMFHGFIMSQTPD